MHTSNEGILQKSTCEQQQLHTQYQEIFCVIRLIMTEECVKLAHTVSEIKTNLNNKYNIL